MDYEKFYPLIINGEKTEYIINRLGIIKNLKTNYTLSIYINNKNRRFITINHKGKRIKCTVARWIAMSFIPIPYGKTLDDLEADHIDADHTNDDISNIQWLTLNEHRYKSAILDNNLLYGEKNGNSKLKESMVREIVKDLNNGISPKKLSKKYNTSKDSIIDIRLGRTWKHISKDYNLERFITRRKNVSKYSNTLKELIYDLIVNNVSIKNKEICKIIDIEYNNKTRCLINNIRRSIYNKGSTTIENDENQYYTIDIHL